MDQTLSARLIAFNLTMLFAFVGFDYFDFNSIMQWLASSAAKQAIIQVSSSYYLILNSITINMNMGPVSYGPAIFQSLDLPLFVVFILVIGNVVGIKNLKHR